jgi:hypothetical protein
MKHAHSRAVLDATSVTGEPFIRLVAALSLAEFRAAVGEQGDWL